MKTLILIRHAKAESGLQSVSDIDRPLNERGIGDAHLVSAALAASIKHAGLLVTSPATRAISTALIFARTFKYPENKIIIHPRFYEARPEDYFDFIRNMDKEENTISIFAHNPTIADALSVLTGQINADVPTCAASVLTSDISEWEEWGSRVIKLSNQIFPRHLKNRT